MRSRTSTQQKGWRRRYPEPPRAWFIVDEGRLRRFEEEFLQVVQEKTELVAAEREMLVFHMMVK